MCRETVPEAGDGNWKGPPVDSKTALSTGMFQDAMVARPRPQDFVLDVSSRSRPVLEDPIPDHQYCWSEVDGRSFNRDGTSATYSNFEENALWNAKPRKTGRRVWHLSTRAADIKNSACSVLNRLKTPDQVGSNLL